MKLKHLMIVSLILAILTVGAASASQDIASNDTVSQIADDTAADEISHDCSEEVLASSDEEPVLQAEDDSQDILGDYSSGGVTIELYNYVDITKKYSDVGHVYDENGLKGTVSLTVDGKKVFTKKYTTGKTYSCYISADDAGLKNFGYGYHTVKLTYNDGKEKSDSRKVNFVDVPSINYPLSLSVGEKNGISIEGDSLNGIATLYYRDIVGYDEYNDPIYKKGSAFKTVKITNGYGWIPLDTLTNGTYSFQLEYKFGTYEDVDTFKIYVKNNSPGFKSSLSKTTVDFGKSITAKLTGPKASGYAYIYVENEYFKSVKFNFGSVEEVISGLSVGKHLVTVNYEESDGDLFYSYTYNVVVNHAVKLKLNKVKVKKSAKKLVIKATLKIDGKAVKNKKLKFKFNKKSYTAKTDKKGVAKITVIKSVLKKLKKGKNVTYQVTYGKKTVEQKVKVKK